MASDRPPAERLLRRNVGFDLATATGSGLVLGLVGALLPGIARKSGMDPLGLAALAAAPFLANMLGILAGRLGLRTPLHAAGVRAIGFGALALAPLLSSAALPLLSLAVWCGISYSVPLQHRTWGLIYPARLRGRLISLVRTGQAAAAGLVAIGGGVLADRYGGTVLLAAAGALGAALVLSYAGVRLPAASAVGTGGYSVGSALRALLGQPQLRLLVLAQAIWGVGAVGATPLYPLVQIDRLQLSLAEIGTLGVATAAATMLSYLGWGALADRRGGSLVMTVAALLGLGTPLAYAFATGLPTLWAAAILAGLSTAAMDMGITASLAEGVPVQRRAEVMAGWSAVTGARGVIAPILFGGLVQAGLVGATTALLVCSAAAVLGLLVYLYAVARRPQSPSARPAPTPAPRPLRPQPDP